MINYHNSLHFTSVDLSSATLLMMEFILNRYLMSASQLKSEENLDLIS